MSVSCAPAAPRVSVLGAGAVGCFIGGAWQTRGLHVTYVGRRAISAAIRDHGLSLSDSTGWNARIAPADVSYVCDPHALAHADIILVCVKSASTLEAAHEIGRHARPGSLVIDFQNGISNLDILGRELGDGFQIVRGTVPFNVAYLGEGRFHKGVSGALWVDAQEETRRLARLIGNHGPASVRLSSDMTAVAWGKLVVNLNNAVNALSGRSLVEQLRQRDYRRVAAASMAEGLAVLRKAGIRPAKTGPVSPASLPRLMRLPNWLFNGVFLKLQKIDSRARSSMADDLAAGRDTEVDVINGELVRLAEQFGAAAPVNRTILNLVHRAEAGHSGHWAPRDLRRRVLGA